MRITKSLDQNSITLSLNGRLDFTARHMFTPAIQEGYEAQKRNLILDLSGVTFIDSAGLGLLHRCITNAKDNKIRVTLVNPRQQVQDILELCQMSQHIADDPSSRSQSFETTTSKNDSRVLTKDAMCIIE